MQRVVSTTIEEAMFSVWFAYFHCGATDMFSMGPPQDYVSGVETNQIRMRERETENGASPRQSRKKGSAED
jgi:hypothetical protein